MMKDALIAATEGNTNFFQKEFMLWGGLTAKYWELIVAIAVLAVLFAAVIVCACIASKKAKRTKTAESEVIDVSGNDKTEEEEDILTANTESTSAYIRVSGRKKQEKPAPKAEEKPVEEAKEAPEAPVEEEPAMEEAPVVEEEPAVEESPVEEAPAQEEAVEAEEVKTVEPVEEVPAEEEKPAEEVKEDKKAAPKAEKKPAAKKKAAPAEKKEEPAKQEEKEEVVAAKDDKDGKVTGKIEICNSNLGGFNYLLKANNGQLLYESKAYKSMDSTKEAIDNFIEAVKAGMFTVRADKFKNYKFVLKSPTSNNLIYVGESFSTEASCKSNIESVKRFADSSPIVDITEKDFVAEFVKYDIPEDIVKAVKNNEGTPGKWSIEQTEENNKKAPYVFLLYANTGQLLYESRDYKSYATCLGGLNTFVNTVRTGNFAIDPDKSGRFKFVLRSAATSSGVEYYGQNYDTRKGCASSIESVYRFALLSPVPEGR